MQIQIMFNSINNIHIMLIVIKMSQIIFNHSIQLKKTFILNLNANKNAKSSSMLRNIQDNKTNSINQNVSNLNINKS